MEHFYAVILLSLPSLRDLDPVWGFGYFSIKTVKVVFQFATSKCRQHRKPCVLRIYPSSTKCLSRIFDDL